MLTIAVVKQLNELRHVMPGPFTVSMLSPLTGQPILLVPADNNGWTILRPE